MSVKLNRGSYDYDDIKSGAAHLHGMLESLTVRKG